MLATNVYHITYTPEAKVVCLYFERCNFRCLGCIRQRCRHDIHLTPKKQSEIERKRVRLLSVGEILNAIVDLEVDKAIYMGEEPSVDPALPEITKIMKSKRSARNILLTNGYVLPDISCIDEVCVGIKAYSPRLHMEYTGREPKKVYENLSALNASGLSLRTESMLIPDYIDLDETELIAKAIAAVNPEIPHRIDAYIPVPDTPWRRPNPDEIEAAVQTAKKYLNHVTFIGRNAGAHETVTLV